MKRQVQHTGIRRWAGADLVSLQTEPLKAIDGFFAEYGPCIITGCEIIRENGSNKIASGLVVLEGSDHEGKRTVMVAPFAGADDVTFPVYLTLAYETKTRVYGDNEVKPITHEYRADASGIEPAIPYLKITADGGPRFEDVFGLTDKLSKTGNAKDVNVTFAETAERTLIESGEKLSVIAGKLLAWLKGLKPVAFSGKAADLKQDTANRFVSDQEKTTWADKYTKAETDRKDQETLSSARSYTDNSISGVYKKTETYTRGEINTKDSAVLTLAQEYARQKIGEIVGSSPAALDTLYELATALNNDPNFATTIMAMINSKADTNHTHAKAQITDFPSSMPASDVYAWAKQPQKPGYSAEEVGAATANHSHTPASIGAATSTHTHTPESIGAAAKSHSHSASQVTEVANKRFMTDAERSKLSGIAAGANAYSHPETHPAGMIVEDPNRRFITDAEYSKLASFDIENFLVKSIFRGNANELIQSGMYMLTNTAYNIPERKSGAILVHYEWDKNAGHQLYFSFDSDNIYHRRKTAGIWYPWRGIAFL